jgi:hypothetical protein
MDNILDNGTVLPSGLLSQQGMEAAVSAFNRSYRNTGIKAGIIVKSYAPDDPFNQTTLCSEYDVLTIEQFENKGSTSILYRNCVASQGFGGIADYLEYTSRPKTFQTNKGFPTFGNQDGAVVIIQCLDNVGNKAIVTGFLIHPDRATKITSTEPQLFGEYNGVAIVINPDGSCSLTFNGATDSKGVPTNSSQGVTQFQIQTDGSYQFTNSSVTILGSKSGQLTINTTSDANITVGGQCAITSTGKTIIQASEIDLDGSESMVLTNVSDPVIDSVFGEPTIGFSKVKAGVDPL